MQCIKPHTRQKAIRFPGPSQKTSSYAKYKGKTRHIHYKLHDLKPPTDKKPRKKRGMMLGEYIKVAQKVQIKKTPNRSLARSLPTKSKLLEMLTQPPAIFFHRLNSPPLALGPLLGVVSTNPESLRLLLLSP